MSNACVRMTQLSEDVHGSITDVPATAILHAVKFVAPEYIVMQFAPRFALSVKS